MKNWTPLMWFYLLLTFAGLVVPWYYNLDYILNGAEPMSISGFISAGFANSLVSSLTSDFLIAATATFTFMLVEARRLRMKNVWIYIVFTFLIAFAFTCPLFLLMRERKLKQV